MIVRDEASDGTYFEWPDLETGTTADPVDDNGTVRPMVATEQALWLALVEANDREAEAVALKDDVQNAKDVRDAAIQSRTDMDPAGPPLPKWEPLTGSGNQSVRIGALEDLVNDLLVEQRRQYGDIRLLAAMLVRKFRKDRDDE